MRLLHYDAHNRLIFTDFRGKSIPPYAILSHRWGDSEILYEDVLNKAYKWSKGGYQKLKFCAERAAQDGLQYFWIDTCCIDRWNNDERSRAIQSMFQWYRNANRCYVFLSDVSLPDGTSTDTGSSGDWKTAFCTSAWFTRGWTLQELIAPASVEFFTAEGQRIGDKGSLDLLLHDITKIPLAALRNCDLGQFSISERREWVRNRTTKEPEDIVYCLLGILGISMPATYKEGREGAERRLQDEIEKNRAAPFVIPFSQNKSLIGRKLQILELEAKLFNNKRTTTMLAVVGPSGTGKSELVLEVAHRTKMNRHCSVFWVDASDEDSIYRAFVTIAQRLEVPDCDNDQADARQIVKRCVSELSRRQCLVIFDNAEGTFVELSSSSTRRAASDLAIFLPRSKLCSVIFTTTQSDSVTSTLATQNIVWLHELEPDAALVMLRNCLAVPISDAEHQDAMNLLAELSYLPLAIIQAGACMNAANQRVQQYRAQLTEHKKASHENTNAQEPAFESSVAATLFLSISRIHHISALAEEYMYLAACVRRKDIPLDLLRADSLQDREDAIEVLDKYGLIIRRPADSAFDVHQLVHSALQQRLQAQGTLEEYYQQATKQLLLTFPRDDHHQRSKWRRLVPHANCVFEHTKSYNDRETLDLAEICAMVLLRDGQYQEASGLMAQVLDKWKQELGENNMRTLRSMARMAMACKNNGDLKEAERLELHVLNRTRSVLGDTHPCTLTYMAQLATTYWKQERWKDAEKLEVQIMETRRKDLGDRHPDTLLSMSHLASTYRDQGRWREAEELVVQAVEAMMEELGEEDPATLAGLDTLALVYSDQGRWKEAYAIEVQVLETRKRVLGDKHPHTVTSADNLALTYRAQGQVRLTARAEYLFRLVKGQVLRRNIPHS